MALCGAAVILLSVRLRQSRETPAVPPAPPPRAVELEGPEGWSFARISEAPEAYLEWVLAKADEEIMDVEVRLAQADRARTEHSVGLVASSWDLEVATSVMQECTAVLSVAAPGSSKRVKILDKKMTIDDIALLKADAVRAVAKSTDEQGEALMAYRRSAGTRMLRRA